MVNPKRYLQLKEQRLKQPQDLAMEKECKSTDVNSTTVGTPPSRNDLKQLSNELTHIYNKIYGSDKPLITVNCTPKDLNILLFAVNKALEK